jgi:hypothetical protein
MKFLFAGFRRTRSNGKPNWGCVIGLAVIRWLISISVENESIGVDSTIAIGTADAFATCTS